MAGLATSQREIGKSHQGIADAYASEIITPIRELKTQVKGFIRELSSEKAIMDKERKTDTTRIKSLHKSYSNSLLYFTNYKTINKGIDKERINDPWIIKFSLAKAISEASTRHVERVKQTKATIERYMKFEQSIFEQLKSILAPLHTKAKGPLGQLRADAFSQISSVISSMDHKADWQTFTSHYDDFVKNSEPSPDEGINDLDDPKAKIIMQGKAYRPKSIPKGWKECFVVLTACGFMYEFESKEASEATSSGPPEFVGSPIVLAHKKLHPDELHPDEFFLSESHGKMFGGDELLIDSVCVGSNFSSK